MLSNPSVQNIWYVEDVELGLVWWVVFVEFVFGEVLDFLEVEYIVPWVFLFNDLIEFLFGVGLDDLVPIGLPFRDLDFAMVLIIVIFADVSDACLEVFTGLDVGVIGVVANGNVKESCVSDIFFSRELYDGMKVGGSVLVKFSSQSESTCWNNGLECLEERFE